MAVYARKKTNLSDVSYYIALCLLHMASFSAKMLLIHIRILCAYSKQAIFISFVDED